MAWQLNFPKAQFRTGNTLVDLQLGNHLQCVVRNVEPGADVPAVAALEVQPKSPSLSADQFALNCSDAYVRQKDLIAKYPQTEPWPFGFQIDLRVHERMIDAICGIEFWFSIQTSFLESNPSLTITPMQFGPNWRHDGDLMADTRRAAIFIHPLDQSDCKVVVSQSSKVLERLEIFGGFMEKGVIRRARVLLAWSDSEVKGSAWQSVKQLFSESPLPLTV